MIEVKSITKSFNGRRILNNLSFDIYPDEVTFIIGRSGAGKTTLLNIMGGLLKQDSGSIFVDGEDISSDLDTYRSKRVGFIFQDFNLISGLSIKDNIKVGSYYTGYNTIYNAQDTNRLLNGLELHNPNQKVETLSGGEKQRCALARSIIKDSRIIIADEPTGNLDSTNSIKVLELLSNNKNGRYVIVVSHDMELANTYADRIIEISDGNIISDNKKSEVIVSDTKPESEQNSKRKDRIARNKANWILGMNEVKRKKGKLLSIMSVIALAITSLAIVLNMTNWGNSVTEHTNKYYLETDLINITQNKRDTYPYYTFYPFSNEQISDLKEEYKSSTFLPKYYIDSEVEQFLIGDSTQQLNSVIKQISMNDDFFERVRINDIEGDLPKTDEEIILAEDINKQMFGDNGIGKKITIYGNNGGSVECTVSGINHTSNPFGSIYTYVSAELIRMLYSKQIESTLNSFILVNEVGVMNGTCFPGAMRKFESSSSLNLFVGRTPETKNEILISSMAATKELGTDWLSTFGDHMDKKYCIDINGRYDVTIVGVYESSDMEILCSEELMEDILIPKPVSIDIYLSDDFDTKSTYDQIMSDGKYFCTYKLEQLKKEINATTGYFKIALVIVGIILTIISVALLNSYAKITILERKHELAILKCLGAKKSDILMVLLFDSFLISVMAFIFSMGLTFIANCFMPKVFGDINYIDFNYPWKYLLCIGIGFSILTILVTSMHFMGISKKMPADLLKE